MRAELVEHYFAEILGIWLKHMAGLFEAYPLSAVLQNHLYTSPTGTEETWLQNDARVLYRKIKALEICPENLAKAVLDHGDGIIERTDTQSMANPLAQHSEFIAMEFPAIPEFTPMEDPTDDPNPATS